MKEKDYDDLEDSNNIKIKLKDDYFINDSDVEFEKDLIIGEDENIIFSNLKANEEKISKNSLKDIFENLERDLILKNNCFDSNKENKAQYYETGIIGNPPCVLCSISSDKDSTLKLYYCEYCKKLFCQDCFSAHYKSQFENIENAYIKYIKAGISDDMINQKISIEINKCRVIFYFILILGLNFFYLLPIFAMKQIISTLEIILLNCIKEVFTDKVEDPNSLFNFYHIFFDKNNTLNLNFDLIMIMNWIGYRFLCSWGFIATVSIFTLINFGFFIALYNFNFLEFNENNKFGIFKFIELILIYLLLFIGLGGSSLLSQKIFVELFNKYEKYFKEREEEKKQKEKKQKKEKEEKQKKEKEQKELDNFINNIPEVQELELTQINNSNDSNNESNKEENKKNNLGKKVYVKQSIKESIKASIKRTKTQHNEKIKYNSARMSSFFSITIITILSFFNNFYLNIELVLYKFAKDEELKELNNKNSSENIINRILTDDNNTYVISDLTKAIYAKDQVYFFRIYSIYYVGCMIISIIFYLISYKACLRSPTKPEKKEKVKSLLEKKYPLLIRSSTLRNDPSNLEKNIIKQIEEDQSTQSYTICNFCGFFYYSSKSNSRGNIAWYYKFGYCLRDFFILNCKSLFDCCDITLCQALNIIFCSGKEVCNCKCKCCGCDEIPYTKTSEEFCFCFKQKRKYKWFHDYITSEVQKDVSPYILEYFLLGLLIISFQKKFVNFKVKSPISQNYFYDNDITWEEEIKSLNDWIIFLIIFVSLFIFFLLTNLYGKIENENKDKSKEKKIKKIKNDIKKIFRSNSVFNGLHIILLLNSLISITFSVLYFLGIKNFRDFALIPILMYQYFYFSLNYYCICVSEQENNRELILSGGILVTIYIKVWNAIYSIIQDLCNQDNEIIFFIFQASLSGIVVIFFIYYLICSKFRYQICYNCAEISLCGFCQSCCSCCKYNIYCEKGSLNCDCCCCDEESRCYSERCEESYYECYDCCSSGYTVINENDY